MKNKNIFVKNSKFENCNFSNCTFIEDSNIESIKIVELKDNEKKSKKIATIEGIFTLVCAISPLVVFFLDYFFK